MRVIQAIKIFQTAPVIFDYLMDVNNRKDFIPALDEVVLIDPLPLQKGSRYIEVARIAGRRLETTYQIIGFKKNKGISAQTLKSIFPIRVDLLIKEENDSCLLIIRLDFQLAGIFKLVQGVVKGIVNQQAKSILQKVKSNIEVSKNL